eukprot:2974122-Alexandrium_andersonii.AAC.1
MLCAGRFRFAPQGPSGRGAAQCLSVQSRSLRCRARMFGAKCGGSTERPRVLHRTASKGAAG